MNQIIAILQIIPMLIQVIKAVEEAIPFSGKGKEKLDAVINIVDSMGELAKQIPLEKIISILVNLFNITGVFRKGV